jgi:hypothetical protein
MDLSALREYLADNYRRLLPLILLLLISMGLSMLTVSRVLPPLQEYQILAAEFEDKQAELAARNAVSSDDDILILEARIVDSTETLTTLASGLLTELQADALLNRLYLYADVSGVEIRNLQLQAQATPRNTRQQVTTTSSYSVRTFRIELIGSVDALLDFVTLFQEAALPSVSLSGLSLNSSTTGGTLTMLMTVYSSLYADGSALASMPVIEVTPEVAPEIIESTPEAESTEVVAEVTEEPDTITLPLMENLDPAVMIDTPLDDPIFLLVSLRADLELLASTTLGLERPAGWSGMQDSSDPQFSLLIRLDLETLAGALLGESIRPDGWIGALRGTTLSVAQDSRHDLELLADAALNNMRPIGWNGANPVLSCDRSISILVQYLLNNSDFVLETTDLGGDFCTAIETAANEHAYTRMIDITNLSGDPEERRHIVNSPFAVAFNNRNASQRMGIIPENTPIVPVARSYAQYSNMMLVRGEGFEVFMEYLYTSLSEAEFFALPDIDTLVSFTPFCSAYWCE